MIQFLVDKIHDAHFMTMLLAAIAVSATAYTLILSLIHIYPQMFGSAANNGQMIAEVSANHRTTEMFLQIAQRLTGRGETKKPRGSFLSVSYTHLDVYKRQSAPRSAPPRRCRPPCARWKARAWYERWPNPI